MSKSYRKTPIIGIAGSESDKPGKVVCNRATRRANKTALMRAIEQNIDFVPVLPNDTYSTWEFPKDGKQYIEKSFSGYDKLMRK